MGLTIQIRDVDDVLKNVEGLNKDQRKELSRITKRQAFQAQAKLRSHYGGRTLQSRSGKLRQSVRVAKVRGRNDMEAFEIGTNVRYASIHEEGGIIRPRHRGGRMIIVGRSRSGKLRAKISRGTKLAIPIGEGRTRRGVARNQHIDKTALQVSRGLPFTTFIKNGVLLMAYGINQRVERTIKRGKNAGQVRQVRMRAKVVALAKLVDKVIIRGRHPAKRVADDVSRAWTAQMRAAVRIAIRKNGGA